MRDVKRNSCCTTAESAAVHRDPDTPTTPWARPVFEVIALDCEITAYAPAGDEPLF